MNWLGFAWLAATGCLSSVQDTDDSESSESEDTASIDTDSSDTDTDTDTDPTGPVVIIPDFVGDLSTVHTTITSNSSGIATAYVEVPSGAKSFLLTAENSQYRIAVERVRSPSGALVVDWEDWGGNQRITQAFYVASENVFNYPMRLSDPPLTAGVYEVEYAVATPDNYYAPNVEVDLAVQIKTDSDLSTGTLHVEVFLTDPVANDNASLQAVYEAVDRWNVLWNDKGLAVEATFWTAGLPGSLAAPGGADGATYAALTAGGSNKDITLIMTETVQGSDTLLGIAGGIPGQLIEGQEAVVLVSVLNSAGVDGVFDDEELDQFAETLAHEAGHYMGLFHPVEIGWDAFDAHSDTLNCTSENQCATQLGDNLMFPTPVCGSFGCIRQDRLSAQQQGALHLYTGTL